MKTADKIIRLLADYLDWKREMMKAGGPMPVEKYAKMHQALTRAGAGIIHPSDNLLDPKLPEVIRQRCEIAAKKAGNKTRLQQQADRAAAIENAWRTCYARAYRALGGAGAKPKMDNVADEVARLCDCKPRNAYNHLPADLRKKSTAKR